MANSHCPMNSLTNNRSVLIAVRRRCLRKRSRARSTIVSAAASRCCWFGSILSPFPPNPVAEWASEHRAVAPVGGAAREQRDDPLLPEAVALVAAQGGDAAGE